MTTRRFNSFTDSLSRPFDIDMVTQWLAARDSEKSGAKVYHGERPCLPADVMLAVAEGIWRKRK
jgi:hypothetical protein